MLIDLKGKIDYNKIIVSDFSVPLLIMDRSPSQKKKKEEKKSTKKYHS